MELQDYLLCMRNENIAQQQNHEKMRFNAVYMTIVIAGAVLTFMKDKVDGHTSPWIIPVFLIFLGGFGALFSLKEYERAQLHQMRAREYRKILEQSLNAKLSDEPWPNLDSKIVSLDEIRTFADKYHFSGKFKHMKNDRLNHFWTFMPLLISIIGTVLLLNVI